jgi:drug/metabolite transporter (DMT)-like permease
MYINFLSEAYAFQKISSIMVSIFYLLSPIFSAIIDYILTNNKLTKEQIITITIGTCLSIYMIFLNTNEELSFNDALYPYLLLLISIITSTIAWYRIHSILKKGYSLVSINGYASMLSGIIFYLTAYCYQESIPCFNNNSFYYIFFPAILLGIISNIICYNLYSKLLKRYNITTILFAELLCPCFTAYYQWLFFNISPKINHFVFFILFMLCIIIFNSYEKKKIIYYNNHN